MTQRIIEYEPVSEEVTSEANHEDLQSQEDVKEKHKQMNISKNKHLRRMSVVTGIPMDETNDDSCQGFKVSTF